MAKKLGRPKAAKPKSRRHFTVSYGHLLEELKPLLTPPGFAPISDSAAVDIAVGTLHEMLVQDKLSVVNTDSLVAVLNKIHMRALAKSVSEIVTGLGHTNVSVQWALDGTVNVHCDGGTIAIPPHTFARDDAASELRAMRRGRA